MKTLLYSLYLFFALLLFVFAAMNSQTVTLHYYWGEWILPLSLLMIFTLCIGCFLGLLISLRTISPLRRELRACRKQARAQDLKV